MIGQQLLDLMYGDPASQISRTLNPTVVNPNPQGGAPSPSGAQGGAPSPSGPPMAPANATQSPPDLAALYTQLHAQDRSANQIDRGLAMMASAFGTAQQQHDMLNYAQSLQPDDRDAMLGKALLAQKELTAQQEHARFMAGSAGMAQLLGVTPDQAQWLMQDETARNEALKTHFENMSKTDLQKNIDAGAVAYKQAHPDATDAEVAQWKSDMVNLTVNPAAREAATVSARESQEFKDSALADYTSVNSKLTQTQDAIDQLLKDPNAVMNALTDVVPTTGPYAAWNPLLSQKTRTAAVQIDKIKAILTGDSLKDVKNVRNIREFETLGRALTADLNAASSPQQVEDALKRMRDKVLDARAAAEAAAGHHLTGDLAGRAATRDLLSPTLNGKPNPYYNGATEDAAAKDGSTIASSGGGPHYVWTPEGGLQQK